MENSKTTLKDVVQFVLTFGHCFGVCTVTLSKNERTEPKKSKFWFGFTLLLLAVFIVFCTPMFAHAKARSSDSKLELLLWIFVSVYINRFLGILIFVTAMTKQSEIISFLKELSEVDNIFQPFGIKKENMYAKIYKFLLKIIGTGVIACTLTSLLLIESIQRHIGDFLLTLLILASLGQFLIYLRLIKEQFAFLNAMVSNFHAKKFLRDEPWSNKHILNNVVPFIYNKLSNAAEDLNRAYMKILFTFVTLTLLQNLFTLFGNYQSLYASRITYAAWDFMLIIYRNSNMSIFLLIYLIALLKGCANTADEANKMGKLVHKIINSNPELSEDDNLKTFSFQLVHNKLQFTVCDMFSLDYSYLYTFTTVITSYMIILIQFDLAKSSYSTMSTPTYYAK